MKTHIKFTHIMASLAVLGLGACASVDTTSGDMSMSNDAVKSESAQSTPAQAAPAQATPAQAKLSEPEPERTVDSRLDEDGKICKRQKVVGSKFDKKVCGTPEQWEHMQSNSRSAGKEMQDRGRATVNTGG